MKRLKQLSILQHSINLLNPFQIHGKPIKDRSIFIDSDPHVYLNNQELFQKTVDIYKHLFEQFDPNKPMSFHIFKDESDKNPYFVKVDPNSEHPITISETVDKGSFVDMESQQPHDYAVPFIVISTAYALSKTSEPQERVSIKNEAFKKIQQLCPNQTLESEQNELDEE